MTANPSNGVTLTYDDGDFLFCDNHQKRRSQIDIICNDTATSPVFTFIGEGPTCVYNFTIESAVACPTDAGMDFRLILRGM